MVYVLVALDLPLIFSTPGVINFAHGKFYMLGGFVTDQAFAVMHLHYIVALALAILTVGLSGMLVERVVFRPFRAGAVPPFGSARRGRRALLAINQEAEPPGVTRLSRSVR